MRNLTAALVAFFCCTLQVLPQKQIGGNLLFEVGKYSLSESSKKLLNKDLEKLEESGFQITGIYLKGHTDADGTEEFNHILSQKRVDNVAKYMNVLGVSNQLVKSGFYGESKPIRNNKLEKGKQYNRRVEYVIEYVDNTKKEPSVDNEKIRLGNIFNEFDVPTQFYTVNSNKTIALNGKKGTGISFPKNAFEDEQGNKIEGNVTISLQEFYDKSDLIKSNLHTQCFDALLESGGTINIVAQQNGMALKLRKKKEMKMTFKNVSNPKNMKLFVGEKNNGRFNWSGRSTRKSIWLFPFLSINDRVLLGKKNYAKYMSNESEVEASNVILKSTSLGFINCDRFYDVPNKTNLYVKNDTVLKPVIKLVFKDINSVMDGYYSENKNRIVFGNIPVGYEATIIAMSFADDKVYYASKPIKISENKLHNVDLVATTLKELEEQLAHLDN